MQPVDVDGCVEALLAGEADVLSIEVESAVDSMERAGATDKLVQNSYQIHIASLHFATHVSNGRGRQYITMLNRGLAEMRDSGGWYDIVTGTLSEAAGISN